MEGPVAYPTASLSWDHIRAVLTVAIAKFATTKIVPFSISVKGLGHLELRNLALLKASERWVSLLERIQGAKLMAGRQGLTTGHYEIGSFSYTFYGPRCDSISIPYIVF